MATIAIYAGKVNSLPGLIKDLKSSVADLKSDLSTMKKKVQAVDSAVCNLDDVVSSITTAAQTEEGRTDKLASFAENCRDFAADAVCADEAVAEAVNEGKDDFYSLYNYLKPDFEKSAWEKFCDGIGKACSWCKEHWESLVCIVVAVAAAVALVVLSVATFGGAAVLAVALTGLIVAELGQLGSDLISWAISGEWTGTWESYIGAGIGGIVGGLLLLTCSPSIASAAESGISTFIGQNLENLTGRTQRSTLSILADSTIDASVAALFSKGFEKANDSFSKLLSKKFGALRRLSGPGSYSASFKMVITKLSKGQINDFTFKTIRNGVFSGLAGSLFENIAGGIVNGLRTIWGN